MVILAVDTMRVFELIRLLGGAARPFVVGKIADRLRGKRSVVISSSELDPRIVLEASRMHEWYCGLSVQDVVQWAQRHPTTDTSMWAVSMDVGLRLHNMICGLERGPDAETWMVDRELVHIVEQHVHWIWRNLETAGGMATSHLLGGLLGVIAAAATSGNQLLHQRGITAARMIVDETSKQFLADGMNFEASTAYHRHVTDILVFATMWIHRCMNHMGVLTAEYTQRVRKAVAALSVLDAAGMPLIGDNDDGMAVKSPPLAGHPPSCSETYRVYSDVFGEPVPKPPTAPAHVAFPDFGLDIWFREAFTCTARCGGPGQYGKGGHAHNDANSITLRVDGVPVIVDPGSFVYTADPQQRNADRSTWSHSTVASDLEQRSWPSGTDGLFWLFDSKPHPQVLHRTNSTWEGQVVHQNRSGYEHRRSITILENEIRVNDRFGDGTTVGSMVLIVCSAEQPTMQGTVLTLYTGHRTVTVRWQGGGGTLTDFRIAPAYGVQVPAYRLIVPLQGDTLQWAIHLHE